MNANLNEIFKLINPANTIGANRFLAHAIGSTEAVIYSALLAKSAYYEERGMISDGWFFSTAADLEESTTFSEKQQRRAIDKLIKAGLIRLERRGMPAKRYFQIGSSKTLEELLALGERIVAEKFGADKIRTRENAQSCDDVTAKEYSAYTSAEPASEAALPCSAETSEQAPPKGQNKFRQNAVIPYKTKNNNHKQKSPSGEDEEIRENFLSDLKKNICYDELCSEHPDSRKIIDDLIEIMLDVICSKKDKVRVNGDNKARCKVAEVYLKLKKEHFLSALNAIRSNSKPVFNRRGYIITVLYNSFGAVGNFSQSASSSGSPSQPHNSKKSSIDTDRLREAIMERYRTHRI